MPCWPQRMPWWPSTQHNTGCSKGTAARHSTSSLAGCRAWVMFCVEHGGLGCAVCLLLCCYLSDFVVSHTTTSMAYHTIPPPAINATSASAYRLVAVKGPKSWALTKLPWRAAARARRRRLGSSVVAMLAALRPRGHAPLMLMATPVLMVDAARAMARCEF